MVAVGFNTKTGKYLPDRIEYLRKTRQRHSWPLEVLAKTEARPHSAPYIVSIQIQTEEGQSLHYCAGSIINENWILTAAHCLDSKEVVENSILVAGCHDIHSTRDDDSVQRRTIEFFIKHELFLGGVNPYDIALIYTRTPFKFSEYVQPVELPKQGDLAHGAATLYGWGNISTTCIPLFPSLLQATDMPILDMELCEGVLGDVGMCLHETNLCTGPLDGGNSICTADSGGPLVQRSVYFGRTTIVGIVSWGKMPCGQVNAPSVFVKVASFIDWIQNTIKTAEQSFKCQQFSKDIQI
ncbi:lectizyme [Eupeodes corollae]|uniref:lectizyme n=1 Tax=Eupeodes corollae TaxID=290404 RepID=UPI0024920707|nr:lectizyme [Eupeodes corollae]